MPDSRFALGVVAGAAVVLLTGVLGTRALSTTESTTRLDEYDTVMVDGRKALAANIVAGRTQSRYHPLPWVGIRVHDVTCPGPLLAVAGTRMTCTGRRGDGTAVRIPVTVVNTAPAHITWKFDR
ncbi:DUF4333 domain-containing protein [Streptomyces acidiscabies]|uniref:DUF4333 domain-containing protein n=1 Tax=Streptomyces acidiscabies TaxID=42234 RepID=A0AAP6BHL5_9ACTN|nr:DUF4333 domain-containing protein [Streptomyces acidiscabies]MBP5934893.1 DUF4333 domain-containing protein [Streptomyces sp. LBUM 1476]MBZ3917343.1 DUF4333 domain-containing protein [Streptomyces acidiscabies]MDX2964868.1 DUF4333 domain-containing protein [Streptomyces acidiscabies]MDX3023369.1 DUF4333 domain-containing protein [Streptomyces acidiscabies]MDX3796523.1 DUF4333 domain-containing protein [Streptomyces acidiscabies]